MNEFKNFINVLVIIILSIFTIGLTALYVSSSNVDIRSNLGLLYLPLCLFILLWGIKLNEDYENE